MPWTTIVTSMPRRDELADGVVNGEAVGDVAAGAVDVQRDRPGVVVGELAQPLDDAARDVFLDVADEVDVAQPIGRFLPQDALDRVDQVEHEPVVQVAVGQHACAD